MTATYTNQPGVRDIDTVRFEINDKDCTPETDAKLSDEEIQYLLDTNSSPLYAAAAACDGLAAQWAAAPTSKIVGDLQLSYGSVANLTSLGKRLRSRAARRVTGIYAGGLTKTDKDTMETDRDRVQVTMPAGRDDHQANRHSEEGMIDY